MSLGPGAIDQLLALEGAPRRRIVRRVRALTADAHPGDPLGISPALLPT